MVERTSIVCTTKTAASVPLPSRTVASSPSTRKPRMWMAWTLKCLSSCPLPLTLLPTKRTRWERSLPKVGGWRATATATTQGTRSQRKKKLTHHSRKLRIKPMMLLVRVGFQIRCCCAGT